MQQTKFGNGCGWSTSPTGETTGVVAVLPSSGATPAFQRTVTLCSFQWHGRTLIPGWGSAPSPRLLRAAEAGGAAVSPLRVPKVLVPQDRVRQWQKNPRVERAEPGHSSRDSHTSPGMQPWIFRPRAHALPGAVICRDKVEILRSGLIPIWYHRGVSFTGGLGREGLVEHL